MYTCMHVLTRFSEWIFNPMRYTGFTSLLCNKFTEKNITFSVQFILYAKKKHFVMLFGAK